MWKIKIWKDKSMTIVSNKSYGMSGETDDDDAGIYLTFAIT